MAQALIADLLAESEALAEKLNRRRDFVVQHLVRRTSLADPIPTGSPVAVAAARADIAAIEARLYAIRTAVAASDAVKMLTVGGDTRTVAAWVIWGLEVGRPRRDFLVHLVNTRGEAAAAPDLTDNLDFAAVAAEIDQLDITLTGVKAAIGVSNATTTVDV